LLLLLLLLFQSLLLLLRSLLLRLPGSTAAAALRRAALILTLTLTAQLQQRELPQPSQQAAAGPLHQEERADSRSRCGGDGVVGGQQLHHCHCYNLLALLSLFHLWLSEWEQGR
jgi:hypothetical protein